MWFCSHCRFGHLWSLVRCDMFPDAVGDWVCETLGGTALLFELSQRIKSCSFVCSEITSRVGVFFCPGWRVASWAAPSVWKVSPVLGCLFSCVVPLVYPIAPTNPRHTLVHFSLTAQFGILALPRKKNRLESHLLCERNTPPSNLYNRSLALDRMTHKKQNSGIAGKKL